ncbi:adenosylcobinamide-phosphate synthase CbiB [Algicella marina]|uniref:Cobalamin biosynthesis protein CobD n=1 Tax=Algicella marina TaxID=2683284 RepID=A0A6P1T2T9_9RHOB|nr:adenosylcobinamide-phosphate synthase CbiB [Algicella marina]QHQ37254.1 cobalamin biosynthesis protein CobD [Algicella marina]
MLIALALDTAFGWPQRLHAAIGHPVTWIGALIAWLERRMNHAGDSRAARRARGRNAALLTIAAAVLPAVAIAAALPGGFTGALLTGLLAAPLIASRSLYEHVADVLRPLARGNTEAARTAVARIVGRDPDLLDAPGIARAAIESLAENASDAVIAPLFWGALLGLPGIVAYKAINTLDSMIGYRSDRFEDFGRFAALLDDAVNWVPARATGLALALAGPRPRAAIAVMRADAPRHRSPNAGWPEAAMAAGIGCRLSGPRAYARGPEAQPWLNGEAPDPTAETGPAALGLYRRMLTAVTLALLPLAMLEAFW